NLVDAVELQRMHALGRSLLETDPEAALVPLRHAVGLFRGPVLAGIRNGLVVGNFAEWAEDSLARTVLRGEADLRTAATHSWHGRALGDAFTASLTERATIPADQRAEWERQAQLLRDAGAALTVEPMPPDGAAGDGREERR
ncbi:BTAD domain-containing putative transcriptional regulator, partial [Micromonospora gifhornensis]